MDFNKMDAHELTVFLVSRGISQEICDLLQANAIDGSTLVHLTNDIDEFSAVLPKSGHRLKLKKAVQLYNQQAKEQTGEQREKNQVEDLLNQTNINTIDVEELKKLFELTPTTSGPSDPLACSDQSPLLDIFGQPPTSTPKKQDLGILPDGFSKTSSQSSIKPKREKRIPDDESGCLPEILPFPSNFSVCVETAMKKGSILPVRKYVIADIGSFFFGITRHPKQGDYKRIALLTCKKFPELMDSNPASYWLSVQKQLSQFFRNLRRTSLSKSMVEDTKGASVCNENASKRVKLTCDDAEAQKRNVDLLQEAKSGGMSDTTYKSLIKDTFSERRNFVQNIAKSSAEVLQKCPYLGKREYIRMEMPLILNKDTFREAESRLTMAFKSLLSINNEGTLGNKDVIAAVEMVEKRTQKKRATRIVKFKDPSTHPNSVFKDKLVQFKVTCIGSIENLQQIFISGEDQVFIECPDLHLTEALVDLISSYYVFDMSYPESMMGILNFLQDIALECPNNCYKGTKYSTFMAELRSKMG